MTVLHTFEDLRLFQITKSSIVGTRRASSAKPKHQIAELSFWNSLTPDWLTDTLRAGGVLERGQVASVTSNRTNHQASLNYFLQVEYSADAPKTAPQSLFLKLSRPERWPLTASEVEYYTKIVGHLPYKIAPTCFSAAYDSQKGAYHILLEDVSSTHSGLELGYPPTPEQALQMAKTLARLHAFWWEKPTLGDVSDLPTEAVINRYVDFCRGGLSPMLDFMGSRLTAEQKALVDDLSERWPRWMLKRTQQQPNHLTLIHGDCHSANFLMPTSDGSPYLIDRQPFEWSLTCWLGVSDVVYMMVHWWLPAYRQRLEELLLRTYHNELLAYGVNNYSWEQLWADYRLCVIQSLYVPLAWCAYGSVEANAMIWCFKLLLTLETIEQFKAQELLRELV